MKGPKNKVPHVPRAFVDMVGDHFLEAARYLREIQDEHPDDFVSVAKNLGIGPRKAYHLAQIDRSFHALGIAPDRLRRIGWTKLSHLAPHIDADNAKELLTLAEAVTAHELKMHLRGHAVDPDTRAVVLYLDKEQYAVFEKALVTAGAVPHLRGLLNKEAALTKLLATVAPD